MRTRGRHAAKFDLRDAIRAFSVALALASAAAVSSVNAETHALLVGVGHYPNLPAHRQLQGPPNDVRAVREALDRMGHRRVAVLSDDRHDALPTRANILTGLDRLITQSQAGDWLLVYFAGHGAQQPVPKRTASEPDDLDEVFLPRDVGRWNPRLRTIENAIVDDEIGAWSQRARAGGRHVWMIFDTCHAGDMAKSFPGSPAVARMREVPGFELGVPPNPSRRNSKAVSGAPSRRWAGPPAGGAATAKQWNAPRFVALYAAQPDEPTPEEGRLYNGATVSMGLFTSALLGVLRQQESATAAAILRAVNERYRDERRVFPNPWGEGDLHLPLPAPRPASGQR